MRYRVYISEVRNYTAEIEAADRAAADRIAEAISNELSPTDMRWGDTCIEVKPITAQNAEIRDLTGDNAKGGQVYGLAKNKCKNGNICEPKV